MPASFPNVNLDPLFAQSWAPGGAQFLSATKYWQDQLKRNSMGQGLPQLAAASQSEAPAEQYNTQSYAPGGAGQNEALGAFGGLQTGLANARNQGRGVQNKQVNADVSGALKSSGAASQSLTDMLQGQTALNAAQTRADESFWSGLTGTILGPGMDLFGGIMNPGGGMSGGMGPFGMMGGYGASGVGALSGGAGAGAAGAGSLFAGGAEGAGAFADMLPFLMLGA